MGMELIILYNAWHNSQPAKTFAAWNEYGSLENYKCNICWLEIHQRLQYARYQINPRWQLLNYGMIRTAVIPSGDKILFAAFTNMD